MARASSGEIFAARVVVSASPIVSASVAATAMASRYDMCVAFMVVRFGFINRLELLGTLIFFGEKTRASQRTMRPGPDAKRSPAKAVHCAGPNEFRHRRARSRRQSYK